MKLDGYLEIKNKIKINNKFFYLINKNNQNNNNSTNKDYAVKIPEDSYDFDKLTKKIKR